MREPDRPFLALFAAISVAFAWVLWPLFGSVLWGTLLAVMFAPLNRRILRAWPSRRSISALCTMLVVIVIILIPVALVTASIVQQGRDLYERVQPGNLNLAHPVRQLEAALPDWAVGFMDRMATVAFSSVREGLSALVVPTGQQLTGHAINIGQLTAEFIVGLFVMLYLLFVLLRDGDELIARIRLALPLPFNQVSEILNKFTMTVRAMTKGDILVALIHGGLVGLIFWILGQTAPLLWAAVMALLSLLPVLGSALVWFPVALYLLTTGAVFKGMVILALGTCIIGLVDNFLRPILIGQDTQMPSYVVLLSTLGGIAAFGVNGLVLGPLIAAMFLSTWDIFISSRTNQGD